MKYASGATTVRARLNQAFRRRFGIMPLADTIPDLLQQQHGAMLDELIRQEQVLVDEKISCLFGYHLLEGSVFDVPALSQASTINHRFRVTPCLSGDRRENGCITDVDCLPLHPETIDVALLHHLLDYSPRPQTVLKAMANVVVPHGYLVIIGFNPYSALGLVKTLAQLVSKKALWRRHGLRLGRVLDWLHLLDFEPVDIQQGFYSLPLNARWLIEKSTTWESLARRMRLPGGGFYIIVARKNVCGLIPQKPRWEALAPVLGIMPGKVSSPLSKPLRPGMPMSRSNDPSKKHQVTEHQVTE